MTHAPRNRLGQFLKGTVPNPRGPKTKIVDAKGLALIATLAARGVRDVDLMRATDMSKPTWLAYKAAHPEIEEAIAAGRQQMHDALVGKLYAKAMKGDTIALLFALKSLYGYKEGTEAAEVRAQVIINLPGAVSLDRYRIIEQEPRALPNPERRRG